MHSREESLFVFRKNKLISADHAAQRLIGH